MATGNQRFIILTALFITASGFADSYAEQAAALSLKGARGASNATNAFLMMNAANANAKAAQAQKEKDTAAKEKSDAASAPKAPAESKFQALKFDSNLPSAIADVSAPAESNVLSTGDGKSLGSGPSSGGGGNLLGNAISGYTDAISTGGKSRHDVDVERRDADIKAVTDASVKQIVDLAIAAKKEIEAWNKRKESRAALEEKNDVAQADKPKNMADRLKALPERDPSAVRELANGGDSTNVRTKGNDKLSLEGITPITE